VTDANPTARPQEPPAAQPARTVTLTPAAVEHVTRLRAKEGHDAGHALRVGVKAGGCSGYNYYLGFTADRRATDLVVEYDGLTVVVDPRSLEILDGTVIDYERGLLGAGIQFRNPRAKRSCGCGESFTV
jgi:iron-sulfur cluster assembly accessory protein